MVIDATTGKRAPIWVELDSNATHAREHRAADPRATQFESGHRYIVAMRNLKDCARQDAGGARGLPLLPRRPALRRKRRSTTRASASRRSSARCARRRSSAPTSTSPGTSRSPATRTSPSACCTSATTPSPSSATPTSRDGVVQGGDAGVHGRHGRRPTPSRRDRPPGPRHVHGPLLPDQRLRGAGGLRPRRQRQPGPARHLHGQLRLHHPPRRRRRSGRRARRGRRSTATACSARPTRSREPAAHARAGAQLRLLRHRRDRVRRRGRPEHDRDPPGPGQVPAAHRPHPAGPAQRAAARPPDGQPERLPQRRRRSTSTAATLASPPVLDTSKLYYNGNSQGGILGGALTAVSPDFTRASLGVPAMGYSTLLTRSIDFDDLLDDPLPGVPERALAPAGAVADPDALGPLRAERLRPADDDPRRCRTRRRTRCC